MTDQSQQPAATPVPQTADPAAAPAVPGKSPLEMLEEMLQATQAQQAVTAPAPAAPPTPAAATTPAPPAPEPQLDPAVIAQAQADSHAQDQVDLKAKLEELKTISQTPEYQARVAQNQAAVKEEAQQHQSLQGFEIHQLDHKKITE